MRFFLGFALGIAASYLLLNRGINLPQRLGNAIDWQEIQRLAQDVVR